MNKIDEHDKRLLAIEACLGDKIPNSQFMEIFQGVKTNFEIIMDAIDLMNDCEADNINNYNEAKVYNDKRFQAVHDRIATVEQNITNILAIIKSIRKRIKHRS